MPDPRNGPASAASRDHLLLLRVDASPVMGIGHFMRCLALAQAWQELGGRAVFCGHLSSPTLSQRLAREGFGLLPLAYPETPPQVFCSMMAAEVDRSGHDDMSRVWTVLDGYHFTSECQEAIRNKGMKLLAIDDEGLQSRWNVDALLNQNLHARLLRYELTPDVLTFFGPDFALLRRDFRSHPSGQGGIQDVGRRLLVSLGGSDPENWTTRMIESAAQAGIPGLQCKVVVGPGNEHAAGIEKRSRELGPEFEVLRSPGDMPALMRWADAALAAAGSTSWELAHMGVPTLLVAAAANQEPIAEHLDRMGAACNLGWAKDLNLDDVAVRLKKLMFSRETRRSMALKGRAVVDGKGALRVAARMRGNPDA